MKRFKKINIVQYVLDWLIIETIEMALGIHIILEEGNSQLTVCVYRNRNTTRVGKRST
jgi:hypothetical protein